MKCIHIFNNTTKQDQYLADKIKCEYNSLINEPKDKLLWTNLL